MIPLQRTLLLVSLASAGVGCSGGAGRVRMQSLSPAKAASLAIEQCDKDADGAIDRDEARSSPGLASAFEQFDADADGRVSRAELEQRLEVWLSARIGMFVVPCRVTLDGRPLADATVRFEPEAFLGDGFQAIEGKTDARGKVALPTPAGMPGPGLLTGLYRVTISKTQDGRELIPARYNSATVLGQEVASSTPRIGTGFRYSLTSK